MIKDYLIYEMNSKEKILFFVSGYIAISTVIFLFYHALLLALISGFVIVKLRFVYESYMVNRRMHALELQFKDLLYSLSASVSAGRQIPEALIEGFDNLQHLHDLNQPIMIELSHMKRCITENNESDTALLKDFAMRSHCEDINNFVQVYVASRSLGGNLERIIMRTSEILSDKISITEEIRVIMSQKKLEGRLIAVMPPAMLLMLNIASPSYIAPLYETFAGRLVMTLALAAEGWGLWLIEKLSAVDI